MLKYRHANPVFVCFLFFVLMWFHVTSLQLLLQMLKRFTYLFHVVVFLGVYNHSRTLFCSAQFIIVHKMCSFPTRLAFGSVYPTGWLLGRCLGKQTSLECHISWTRVKLGSSIPQILVWKKGISQRILDFNWWRALPDNITLVNIALLSGGSGCCVLRPVMTSVKCEGSGDS